MIRKTIMLAECTRFNGSRWCRTFRTLQDEQLSNTFPLHNDKQQRQPSFPMTAKLEYFPVLVEPDGIEPTT